MPSDQTRQVVEPILRQFIHYYDEKLSEVAKLTRIGKSTISEFLSGKAQCLSNKNIKLLYDYLEEHPEIYSWKKNPQEQRLIDDFKALYKAIIEQAKRQYTVNQELAVNILQCLIKDLGNLEAVSKKTHISKSHISTYQRRDNKEPTIAMIGKLYAYLSETEVNEAWKKDNQRKSYLVELEKLYKPFPQSNKKRKKITTLPEYSDNNSKWPRSTTAETEPKYPSFWRDPSIMLLMEAINKEDTDEKLTETTKERINNMSIQFLIT